MPINVPNVGRGNDDFFAIIPAGGSGSRLWPLSRVDSPKFLHDLSGNGKTLIRATWDRLRLLAPVEQILVVTGIAHQVAIVDQLPELANGRVLIEPEPRDSAAAIGFAILDVLKRNPDAIIGSFAADHVIQENSGFVDTMAVALTRARLGNIVTVGIRPTEPSTAFGYIRVDEKVSNHHKDSLPVSEFVEKPSYELAVEFVASGHYFWNAGMFIARASILWDFYEKTRPELAETLSSFYLEYSRGDFEAAAKLWSGLDREAIDYVVAEPAARQGRMEMVVAGFDWDDIGDFAALAKVNESGGNQRVTVLGPNAKVVSQDSTGVVVSQSRRIVSLIGVEDIVVVDTPDALLVTTKSHAQDVKKLVEHMKLEGLDELL